MKTNLKKLIPMILVHLFEIIVLYFVVTWIVNYGPENYKWPAAILMIVFYAAYFVYSMFDDYKEYKKGDFDW